MANELTITLSGDDGAVSVTALIEALENTIQVLRSLEAQHGLSETIRWEVVRATMKSPLTLTIAAKVRAMKARKASGQVMDSYVGGLRDVFVNTVRPKDFDDDSLEAVRRLATQPYKEHAKLTVQTNTHQVVIPDSDPLVVENITRLIAATKGRVSQSHHETGTIEGTLEVVSTHHGDSFSVWEHLTGYKVECQSTPEQLEQAKGLLRSRVAVLGRIRYLARKPVSLEVERIRRLRTSEELPQPSTIGKVDLTGGVASEEFVREGRDAK
ncbi:MAG TPA: hypothetical protein VD866_24425 [Urbifossiella sp.]|nr:hypothetical protein [Urbifossiella sp.]